MADIFADCFAACSGTITSASPGPICGWTYDDFFDSPPPVGSVNLSPGSATFLTNTQPVGGPGMTKPISGLSSINDVTVQFTFTEFSGAGVRDYVLVVNDFANLDWLQLDLLSDGSVFVSVGPQPNGWSSYNGTWTPTPGATHKVQIYVDPLGVPHLTIDGVDMPLVFFSLGAGGPDYVPHDAIGFFALNFSGVAEPGIESKLENLFVATGSFPTDTVFCCT